MRLDSPSLTSPVCTTAPSNKLAPVSVIVFCICDLEK